MKSALYSIDCNVGSLSKLVVPHQSLVKILVQILNLVFPGTADLVWIAYCCILRC